MRTRVSRRTLTIGAIGVLVICAALLIALSRNSAAPAAATTTSTETVASSGGSDAGWLSIPFENVRTNEMMSFADFAGKRVVVEVVSIWCSNCLWQQQQAAQALAQLGENVPAAYISLDLDIAHPNDDAQTVANFEDYKPFSWTFAISNETLTRALIDQFGYNVLNAPITPIFVINPDGTASRLHTGDLSVDELIAMMQNGMA